MKIESNGRRSGKTQKILVTLVDLRGNLEVELKDVNQAIKSLCKHPESLLIRESYERKREMIKCGMCNLVLKRGRK